MNRTTATFQPDVVGVIPAAGLAERLGTLPCSKEMFPTGLWREESGLPHRPKPVACYLLEGMRRAGARRAYIVIRAGKWDIPAYLGDGRLLGMHLAYLMMGPPHGPPFTLAQAYPFVRNDLVITGFPDILFEPADAFVHLLRKQAETGWDVVLALVPTRHPHGADMVDVDTDGRIRRVEIKPSQTRLTNTWIGAAWTPAFTGFLHEFVQRAQERYRHVAAGAWPEEHVGNVIDAAIRAGLRIGSVLFPEGSCLDVGTPEALIHAVRSGFGDAASGVLRE